jgi:hypothetical protein
LLVDSPSFQFIKEGNAIGYGALKQIEIFRGVPAVRLIKSFQPDAPRSILAWDKATGCRVTKGLLPLKSRVPGPVDTDEEAQQRMIRLAGDAADEGTCWLLTLSADKTSANVTLSK